MGGISQKAKTAWGSMALSMGLVMVGDVQDAHADEIDGEASIKQAFEKGVLKPTCDSKENIELVRFIKPIIRNQRRFFARQMVDSLEGECGYMVPLTHALLKKGPDKWFKQIVKDIWVDVETPEEMVYQVEQIGRLVEFTLEVILEDSGGDEEYKITCIRKAAKSCRRELRRMSEADIRSAVKIALKSE